ncbi:MAG: hypothetical protein OXB95_03935 [Rhodobacteraceae bacterium]|nr:hypothetical protein [Paracoccaceae bacterium]
MNSLELLYVTALRLDVRSRGIQREWPSTERTRYSGALDWKQRFGMGTAKSPP